MQQKHPNKRRTAITADEACDFNFPESQEKNYRKTEFILHSHVAEIVGDLIGRTFYDDTARETSTTENPWSISPKHLRDIVLLNILQEIAEESPSQLSNYPIYGSAIAFEPDVWNVSRDLDKGVTSAAASNACLEDATYCATEVVDKANLILTKLNKNNDEMTIYCPYAFRGPPGKSVYKNCSRDQPDFCPSMDLSFAYDYSNVSSSSAEWYTAPRCLYLRNGTDSGYWTSPYFDTGAGNISMVTYSQPIISRRGKFIGIATIDIEVDALCYLDQCKTEQPKSHNLKNIRPVGLSFLVISVVCCLACSIWTRVHEKNRVVKASQPFFLRIICVGCLLMAFSIIPLSIDDSVANQGACSKACMAFPWLLSIGFTITYSALFSKIWRLNKVMHGARHFQKTAVLVKDVILPLIVLTTLNCGILLAWTLADPLLWERGVPDDTLKSRGKCARKGKSFNFYLFFILLINMLALLMANIQAFRARKITTEFSESFYVTMTMVSFLQALVIAVPTLILVQDDSVASYFVWSVLIFVVTNTILGLMFVPKILLVRKFTLNQDVTATVDPIPAKQNVESN